MKGGQRGLLGKKMETTMVELYRVLGCRAGLPTVEAPKFLPDSYSGLGGSLGHSYKANHNIGNYPL